MHFPSLSYQFPEVRRVLFLSPLFTGFRRLIYLTFEGSFPVMERRTGYDFWPFSATDISVFGSTSISVVCRLHLSRWFPVFSQYGKASACSSVLKLLHSPMFDIDRPSQNSLTAVPSPSDTGKYVRAFALSTCIRDFPHRQNSHTVAVLGYLSKWCPNVPHL